MSSINENAPVKCKKVGEIHSTVENVWNVLTDINNWSSWQYDIKMSKINGSLAAETAFIWKLQASLTQPINQ